MPGRTGSILVTHVGSLPRPADLADELERREMGRSGDDDVFEKRIPDAVAEAVRRQVDCGIDVVSDGEMSKPGFKTYVGERLGGIERTVEEEPPSHRWAGTRESAAFPSYYDLSETGAETVLSVRLTTTGPLSYTGKWQVQRDISNLRAAIAAAGDVDAFLPAASPATVAGMLRNAYYDTEQEHLFAVADAMREEYQAIVDAGLSLQIDDPRPLTYYMRNPALSLEDWREWTHLRVESLNYALRGIDPARVRYHTCYGINMGPRVHDLEFRHVIPLMLKVNAGTYSFEASNPRHEHEWRLWEDLTLPEGTTLLPGLVTQSTVLVEHPDLVAERLMRFVDAVGRERVMAGTDCGFSTSPGLEHIDDDIVWAKFRALAEGTAKVNEALRTR